MEPDNSEARQALSLYYRIIGDYDRMLDQAEAAVKIDPLSLPALLESGRAHCVLGNFEKALNAFNEALELDPLFRSAYEGKAMVYMSKKKYEKALRMIKKYAKLIDSKYGGASQLAYVFAEMGDMALAEENLNRMKEREKEEPNHNLSIDFAMIYAVLGNKDLAFDYLQKAVDVKLGSVLLIHSLPFMQELKDDPRYEKMVDQIGLPREDIRTN